VRLLPRQLEPVQHAAEGLAAAAAAELRRHEANQTPQRPAWFYVYPINRWATETPCVNVSGIWRIAGGRQMESPGPLPKPVL
jgi:hypothetical protein